MFVLCAWLASLSIISSRLCAPCVRVSFLLKVKNCFSVCMGVCVPFVSMLFITGVLSSLIYKHVSVLGKNVYYMLDAFLYQIFKSLMSIFAMARNDDCSTNDRFSLKIEGK